VEQWEVKLGHDLEFRMRALEELIGLERTRQLREAILKDKKIDRAAFIEVEKSWVDKHAAEEDGKLDAQHKVFELQTLVQQLRDENFRLDEKLKVVDGTAAEANDKLRRREHDVRQLRAEVDASVIKIRGEEVERLKVIDKVKKKEAEVQRHKETFEKISSQYNRTLEENELLKGKEKELNAKVQDKEQELTRANDEVKRKESELRVMKRNLHLTLPDEYKKMAERIKALEQEKTKLRSQVVELTDKAEEARHLAIERQAELAEEKATVQSKVERLRDLEREATHRRAELTGERKLRGRENRRLLDRNMYYIQKLQTHEDSRVRHSLEQRAVENELAELRKRNMQLLGQILSLDEAKLAAERTARTAVSKSKELQEKLALHNTVHRTELTRVSRLDQPNRPTEDDVAAVFSLARKSHPPRYASQRDNNPNGRASKSPKPVAPQSKAKTPTPADNDAASTGGGGGTLPTPGRPPSGRSEASAGSARSPLPGSTLSSAASMVVDGQETEAADERLATLRQELDAESTARVAAQERVVELAEQLLQKEKESMVADMKHRESKGKDRGGKDKGALRYREVQAQNLSLMARVHDMEVELEQMQFRLVERDEEIRMQRKQTSDLLFKQQVLEEERNKLRDTLDLNGPKEPQGTGN